jgi:hypothetical protein
VEQLLDGKPEEMVELYERLAGMICRCGRVMVRARRVWKVADLPIDRRSA